MIMTFPDIGNWFDNLSEVEKHTKVFINGLPICITAPVYTFSHSLVCSSRGTVGLSLLAALRGVDASPAKIFHQKLR